MTTLEIPVRLSVGRRPTARAEEGPTVIVPLDGTPRALSALPVAKALAAIEGGTMHVVHASERLLPPRELIARLGLSPEDLTGTVVDELAGNPAQTICALADQAPQARIVINAHSEEVRRGHELGSVTEAILAEARCPVVIVRPERGTAPWALRRMMLPHDGDTRTAPTLGSAVHLAEKAGASLFVLHVATLTGRFEPEQFAIPTYVDQPQHEWPEWAREFLERMEVFYECSQELQPRLFLTRGEPGEEILRFASAREIDLIAIAWHGTLDLDRAQILREVILNAPCPVLFLRADAPAAVAIH